MLAQLAEPLRVLLAEDNPTNQLVFAKLMQNFNVAVTIAENGREAVEQASHRTFDIVFMDMRMPEMDGLEAARAIRALGGDWARIPMIALTANAFADDVKACRDAGMDEFIAKPMRKKVLIEKLACCSPDIRCWRVRVSRRSGRTRSTHCRSRLRPRSRSPTSCRCSTSRCSNA